MPRLVRELRLGPEDPYWYGQQTTGFEAALYVGTIPLILAFVALAARPSGRATMPWRLLIPVTFALATMPRWWPQGYLYLLAVPGVGYFRVSARYTLLTSLGVALVAGEGLDRTISPARFRLGLAAAIVSGGCAASAAALWASRADVHLRSTFGIPDGFLWALLAWAIAPAVVLAWRAGRIGGWAPLGAAALELGILYYAATTQWGWSIAIPAESPVLSELTRQESLGLVGGDVVNLPLRAGLATAFPYIGFAHPDANKVLVSAQERLLRSRAHPAPDSAEAMILKRWLRRCGVTHLVDSHPAAGAVGEELGRWRDPALDRIIHHEVGEPATRSWSIVRVDDPFPEARVAPARARRPPRRLARTALAVGRPRRRLVPGRGPDSRPARRAAGPAGIVGWDHRDRRA